MKSYTERGRIKGRICIGGHTVTLKDSREVTVRDDPCRDCVILVLPVSFRKALSFYRSGI